MSEPIQVGDRVTHPAWDGHVSTVDRIRYDGGEAFAFFTDGGFWRTSTLVKVQTDDMEAL